MVTVRPLEEIATREMEKGLLPDSPQRVLNSAAQILSNLTHFAGVVMTPKRAQVFKHIEFLRLGEGKILLIMVTPEGDVQNRILPTSQDYTPSQLVEAGNYINTQFAGKSFAEVRAHLASDLDNLRSDISGLMALALHSGVSDYGMGQGDMLLSGERRLLNVGDLSTFKRFCRK
jgi:heat-inducible transcriptional repressor